ncbi:MAG: hypothetical protein BECKG1743E_GA0114224_106342 [Candidatus Kentron sp. G]|nr:MAG: hypothetical protein BECKG1743E_GA0114224_106342 [Candidatus Kentron sp. G]
MSDYLSEVVSELKRSCTRSLSDLGGIGYESGKLAHVSRKFSLNSSLLGLEFTEKWPQFPTFSLRFPKSDRLLGSVDISPRNLPNRLILKVFL